MIRGGRGKDTIDGGDGNDMIRGGRGHDILMGGAGSDHVKGGRGNDLVDGGDGNDLLNGGKGADLVFGGFGDDRLFGGDGFDGMDGAEGNDYLNGGRRNDILSSWSGDDTMVGGQGADIFVFDNLGGAYQSNKITIKDFEVGVDTFIVLDQFIDVTVAELVEALGQVIDGDTYFFGGSPEGEVNTIVFEGITDPTSLIDDFLVGRSFNDIPNIENHPLYDLIVFE